MSSKWSRRKSNDHKAISTSTTRAICFADTRLRQPTSLVSRANNFSREEIQPLSGVSHHTLNVAVTHTDSNLPSNHSKINNTIPKPQLYIQKKKKLYSLFSGFYPQSYDSSLHVTRRDKGSHIYALGKSYLSIGWMYSKSGSSPVVEQVQVHSHNSHDHGCYLHLRISQQGCNSISQSLVNRRSGFLRMTTITYFFLFLYMWDRQSLGSPNI